jgi:N-acetylglucosaminyl-diphospho-decaprenol L-rhamnosyltransferase
MNLSVIVVNWNSTGYMRECIESILQFTRSITFEIIVVDNASPVQDFDGLTEHYPVVKIIKSPRNVGFAKANNLGFSQSSGDCVLFVNPDTKLVGPAINVMLERLQSLPDAGVMGCKLLNTDHSLQTSCIQKFPTILNQLIDIEYLRSRWPNSGLWGIGALFAKNRLPMPVEAISGACMMLTRKVFEKVGLFSEDYFMYAEDLDLCYKVARAGFTNYYVGEVEVIHHGGRSSKQRRADQWATIMKFQAVQHFCAKTRGRVYGFVYRAAMGCSACGRLLLIGLVFPFASVRWDTQALSVASAKWNAVLRWALGLEKAALKAAESC